VDFLSTVTEKALSRRVTRSKQDSDSALPCHSLKVEQSQVKSYQSLLKVSQLSRYIYHTKTYTVIVTEIQSRYGFFNFFYSL